MRSAISSTCRCALVCAFLSALLFAGSGCGTDTTTVAGEVMLDGSPIENGTITFEAVEGNGPTMSGQIVNGRYELKGTAGKKKVLVQSFRFTGRKVPAGPPMPPGAMIEEMVMFPPQGKSHDPKEVELTSGSNSYS